MGEGSMAEMIWNESRGKFAEHVSSGDVVQEGSVEGMLHILQSEVRKSLFGNMAHISEHWDPHLQTEDKYSA